MTKERNAIHWIFKSISEQAPTIVFLHDSLGCTELWRDFPERLGEHTELNIIIYDRLGYGKSGPFDKGVRTNDYLLEQAEELNILLDRWKIEKAILFGHSDGGSIALLAAALFPKRIIGIITEGAHVFVEDITLKGIRDAVKLFKQTNLKEKLGRYHGVNTEAMFWAWADTWLNDQFKSWNIEGYLPRIQCESLIIQGLEDEYGSLKQVTKILAGTQGNATSFLPPMVGHSPHKEIPDLVLEKSSEFITRIKLKTD